LSDIVYLDHAATSGQRPSSVVQAVTDYINDIGVTPGRSGHRLAVDAGRVALACRKRVAQLLGIPGDIGRIAFMANATHALNTAMHGVLRQGDRVVITVFDHNSVLRPAAALHESRGVDIVMLSGGVDGDIDEAALRRVLDGARLLVINGASNVLGCALDVGTLAAAAREAGVLTLVDAAQTAGHVSFDAAQTGVDMVAFTGHKGMLGVQGIGGLWVREGVDVDPLIVGGTGGNSLERTMPAAYPDHLEAGTLNGPAMAGLSAGIDAVLAEGVDAIHARTSELKHELHESLAAMAGVRVVSSDAPGCAPIVTMVCDTIEPSVLAARLDREYGVLTRSGLHCAPEAHRLAGTDRTGAVRFSLGWSSTHADIERAIAGVHAIAGSKSVSSAISGATA